jgi:nitroreductase
LSENNDGVSGNQGIHSILRERWSPTTWDSEWAIPLEQVDLLLEAARWAPSAGNSQPWSFILARRGDENHRRLVGHLARSSSSWAPQASLLVVNLCHRFVEGTDWEFSEFAMYDLGQAVAHLTIQAAVLGLAVHQFAAFDHEAVKHEFEVPDDWQVATMSAIGRVPAGVAPHGQRKFTGETLTRDRHSIADIQWNPRREG